MCTPLTFCLSIQVHPPPSLPFTYTNGEIRQANLRTVPQRMQTMTNPTGCLSIHRVSARISCGPTSSQIVNECKSQFMLIQLHSSLLM